MIKITNANITIMALSLERTISFYVDILGFKLDQRFGDYYCQVSASGIVIGLHPVDQKFAASENISIGFTVDDFDGAKKVLSANSIQYEFRKEQGGEFIHFLDPDGNALYFIKPQSKGMV
jgi:catechol 2,3-dioxygenase-like lactoylglutathione lyase family enzyme